MRIFPILMAVLLTGGCSWQDSLNAVSQSPGYLRLDDRVWIENTPRWRLPASAIVGIADDGVAPQQWLAAAHAGVAEIFPASSTQSSPPQYSLHIQWSATSQNATAATSSFADAFSFLHGPVLAPEQSLTITLTDIHGHFLTRVKLHISPEFWREVWQDMGLLQKSFTRLATALRGV